MRNAVYIALVLGAVWLAMRLLTGRAPANVVREKVLAGATVLDVRTLPEYEQRHYPDALHIPLNQLAQRLDELGDRQAPVVVYCLSGGRAASARRMLLRAGFTDVVNAGSLGRVPPR